MAVLERDFFFGLVVEYDPSGAAGRIAGYHLEIDGVPALAGLVGPQAVLAKLGVPDSVEGAVTMSVGDYSEYRFRTFRLGVSTRWTAPYFYVLKSERWDARLKQAWGFLQYSE